MNRFDTGKVTGRYTSALKDAVSNPLPATGTVTFTPQADYVLSPNNATVLSTPIIAVLDSQGYLSTADTSKTTQRYMRDIRGGYIPKYRGVNLQATDGDTNPTNWTWRVDFDLTVGDHKVKQESFSFSLPAGSEIDLTTVTPVPGVSGYSTIQGPQGDSIAFLDEQPPEEVKKPTNGDIVPFEGTLYGFSDGEWKCLIDQASTTSQTPTSTEEYEMSGEGYEFVAVKVGRSVTLSGYIYSESFVMGQLNSDLVPLHELSFPIVATDGLTTSIFTLFDNGSFQVNQDGKFAVSVSYVAGV